MIHLADIHLWCEEKFGYYEPSGPWHSVWEDEVGHSLIDINENRTYAYQEVICSPSSPNLIRFYFVNEEDAVLFRLTWG